MHQKEKGTLTRRQAVLFEKLYHQTRGRVARIILLNAGRIEDFEDAVSETYIPILERFPAFLALKEGERMAYLDKVASNVAKRHYREQCRRNALPYSDEIRPLDDSSLLEEVERGLFYEWLRSFLDPESIRILTYSCVFELSFREIALILNKGEDYVYYHYRKAMRLARKKRKKNNE